MTEDLKLSTKNVLWVLGRIGGTGLVEDVAWRGGWAKPTVVKKLKAMRGQKLVRRLESGEWKITTKGIDRIS